MLGSNGIDLHVTELLLGENSLKLSQDSGVVDQYIYSVTIAIGLTHSIRMKVKQFH